MSFPREKPKRAWMPKVKTGCRTCKTRKVKCDEIKPFCHRCTSTGRKCDGYSPPPESKPPSHGQEISHITARLATWFGSISEQRSFEYYQDRVSPELGGYFDSAFWSREVLQAAIQEPAIRHLVVALGAIHEQYATGRADTHFVLQQCNRSIHHLIKLSEPNDSGRDKLSEQIYMLTAAVLFICISRLQGHRVEAIEHLRGGLKVLHEVDRTHPRGKHYDSTAYPVSLTRLRTIFTSLNTQARAYMTTEALVDWPYDPQMPAIDIHKPPIFLTFSDAQTYVEALYNNILSFQQRAEMPMPFRPSDEEIAMEQSILRTCLARSVEALTQLVLRAQGAINDLDRRAVTSIRLYQTLLDVWLHHDVLEPANRENVFDGLGLQMRRIVAYSTEIMESSTWDQRPSFGPGLGVVMPLHMVAVRCRDPLIRRQALNLMFRYPRREGFWDGVNAAKIAAMRINIEEQLSLSDERTEIRSPSDVPENARIREVKLRILEGRKAELIFISVGAWKLKQPGIVRIVEL